MIFFLKRVVLELYGNDIFVLCRGIIPYIFLVLLLLAFSDTKMYNIHITFTANTIFSV